MFLISPVVKVVQDVGVVAWDLSLTMYNLVTPSRPEGQVVPAGCPGAGGKWPEYIAPKEGDVRCSCPALNAMANHGLLPRDGRGITFTQLNHTIRQTYNFAPTFCFFVPNFSANMLKKSYSKDKFDLSELDVHNGIEHDASLTREDVVHQPNQGKPHVPFIRELLDSASGKDKNGNVLLTAADVSAYSAKRRVDAKATNPGFSLSTFHKMFGSSNSSTLLTIFGGRIEDLEEILIEERIPEGWESRIRKRMGLTICSFNRTVLKVELGIDEKKVPIPTSSTKSAESPSS